MEPCRSTPSGTRCEAGSRVALGVHAVTIDAPHTVHPAPPEAGASSIHRTRGPTSGTASHVGGDSRRRRTTAARVSSPPVPSPAPVGNQGAQLGVTPGGPLPIRGTPSPKVGRVTGGERTRVIPLRRRAPRRTSQAAGVLGARLSPVPVSATSPSGGAVTAVTKGSRVFAVRAAQARTAQPPSKVGIYTAAVAPPRSSANERTPYPLERGLLTTAVVTRTVGR